MNIQRISPMAYKTVLDMAGRNYSTDQGPWLWMVVELGWEREAAWLTLLDACDPFQDAVPCWRIPGRTLNTIKNETRKRKQLGL